MSWQDIVVRPAESAPAPGLRSTIVTDGYALPVTEKDAFARGTQNDVPTITVERGRERGGPIQPTTRDAFENQARQRYGRAGGRVPEALPRVDG